MVTQSISTEVVVLLMTVAVGVVTGQWQCPPAIAYGYA